MEHFHLQRAFRAIPQGHGLPSARGLLCNPVVDPRGGGLRLKHPQRATTRMRRRWDDRLRIRQVHPLVLMHIPDENLALRLKGAQEGRIMPWKPSKPTQAKPIPC